MKVIILAAGRGTRLQPLTNEVPKALIRVGGRPILEWQIKAYLSSGIEETDILVVAGFKSDLMRDFLKMHFHSINMVINKEFMFTNNMYSLYLALNSLREIEDIMISNGDCIYNCEIIKGFLNFNKDNAIACDVGKYNEENMKVLVKNGKIWEISKTIPENLSYGLSIDLYKLGKNSFEFFLRIIETIIHEDKNLWAEEALNIFVKRCDTYPYNIGNKHWIEIDTLEDLRNAKNMFG